MPVTGAGGSGLGPIYQSGGGGAAYHYEPGPPSKKWRIEIEHDGLKCEAEFEGTFAKDFLLVFVQDFIERISQRGTK